MSNNEFLPAVTHPTTVKAALVELASIVQKQNKPALLLKVGALQGSYAIYERTKDASILEQIIMDIIALFKEFFPLFSSMSPHPDLLHKPDLIYAQPSNAAKASILVSSLIDDFLKALKEKRPNVSENTQSCYGSSLRKIFGDMGVQAIPMDGLLDLATAIENHLKQHPEYNHNVVSAARGIIKHLRTLAQRKN